MRYTKQSVIAAATRSGSTATTFAEAYRYLRARLGHAPYRSLTISRKLTALPRGCYRVSRGAAGTYDAMLASQIVSDCPMRDWTPSEAWHAVQSRTRWEARQDRIYKSLQFFC